MIVGEPGTISRVDPRQFWAAEREPSWPTDKYWNTAEKPYRRTIIEALASLGPVTSILEVGCNAVPNWRLIRARWPDVRLFGLEINLGAVEAGRQHCDAEGWRNWTITQGCLPDDLEGFPTGAFDVVLSCYTLAYMEPLKLGPALGELVRVSRQALVLCEPLCTDSRYGSLECGWPGYVEWHHRYDAWFPKNMATIEHFPMPDTDREQRLSDVLVVKPC